MACERETRNICLGVWNQTLTCSSPYESRERAQGREFADPSASSGSVAQSILNKAAGRSGYEGQLARLRSPVTNPTATLIVDLPVSSL